MNVIEFASISYLCFISSLFCNGYLNDMCNYIKTYFYPIQISFTVYDNGYYSYTAAWLKIKNPWRAWGLLGVYFKINVIIYRVFRKSEPYQIYVFNGIFFFEKL